MLSAIPARFLTGFELARLGNNLAAAVRQDRRACCSAAGTPLPPDHDFDNDDDADVDADHQVEVAIASEHVAS